MTEMILYGAVTIVLTLVVIFIIRSVIKRKKDKSYYNNLEGNYKDAGVYQSLCIAKNEYKSSSLEYMAIDKGLYYLDHSILMDYRTCFNIIENVFHSKDIRLLHKNILEEEKAKCILLLEKGEK